MLASEGLRLGFIVLLASLCYYECMDDTKTVGQNPVQQPQQQPVSSGPKEAPAMPPISSEWVASSTPEVVLPQDVKAAGVEARSELPSLTEDQKSAGLRAAKEATEVKPIPQTALNMQSPRSLLLSLKETHKKIADSFTWLVRLIIREQDKREHEGV